MDTFIRSPPYTSTWKIFKTPTITYFVYTLFFGVDVNGTFYFYDWNNDLIDISLIRTTEHKYVTRI